MGDLNFCPFCDAPSHKILLCKGDVFFCKECSRFFKLEEIELQCPRCDSKGIKKSEFPAPNGEAVFQCSKCKKALSASEFLKANKIK
jgi:DNA-directed RNA polymerase subunit RPC12/RpoP